MDRWIDALASRYLAALSSSEFLKAVRALSARYVERREELPTRSPLDSPGKRAAFAAFYAPMHALTTAEVIRALGLDRVRVARLLDLGCGTGAASAAWATMIDPPPAIEGVDRQPWAVAETAWTWRQCGLSGRARRADLLATAATLARSPRSARQPLGVVLGWTVNELDRAARARLLPVLMTLASAGATVLVIEPLARRATPWWPEWADTFVRAGGRADEWRFDVPLPPPLARIDEAARFRRDGMLAKTLLVSDSVIR